MSRKRPHGDKESETNKTVSVVKKALRSSCKNYAVYDQIQKDVEEMSCLFVEVSRYIHFTLMKRWVQGNFDAMNFLDCYYHLMVKKKPKYTIDKEYNTLRKNLKLYDSSYRSNLFVENANKFLTIFHNNIWMHGYTRLRKYFKFEEDKKKVYNTLSYLFDKNCKNIPDEALLDRMRVDLLWNGNKLYEMENVKLFWSSIELFYNLQRYNEINEIKNFSLIPQLKHGLHPVRYDRFAFHHILCRLKLFKGPFSSFDKSEFKKYFKIPSTCTKTFSSLQTDGVSISFCMEKQIKVQNETKLVKKRKLKPNETDCTGDLIKIRGTKYDNKIGLDPGCRLILAGIQNNVPVKIKNSYYQHLSGFYSRKIKLEKYTKDFTTKSELSANSSNFREYCKFQLEILQQKQQKFSQRKVARLKLKKYICRQKASNQIAQQLVPNKEEKTLICIGSTEIASNSPMRGYRRTPNRLLIAALKQRHADILMVNEFRTTKLCAKCYNVNLTSKSPHRYQFCQKCGTCWNRDVNAGKNILYLGECIINQEQKHHNFHN